MDKEKHEKPPSKMFHTKKSSNGIRVVRVGGFAHCDILYWCKGNSEHLVVSPKLWGLILGLL